MAIVLEKKKPIDINKIKPGIQKIIAGLGWDEATINGTPVDCDVSVFLLGANGKLVSDEHFIFYNNLSTSDGSVIHTGDNRDGDGEGDDESIRIDLSKIDSRVEFLYFVITIHESEVRGHHFGNVENSFINIRSSWMTFFLSGALQSSEFNTVLIIASISRNGGNWSVEAMGQAFSGGLSTLIDLYQ